MYCMVKYVFQTGSPWSATSVALFNITVAFMLAFRTILCNYISASRALPTPQKLKVLVCCKIIMLKRKHPSGWIFTLHGEIERTSHVIPQPASCLWRMPMNLSVEVRLYDS
ncbi:hypothetical protein F4808DRAFT_417403 [Astrocystis sublimbata]|nr:hypothetical protein F4808DRAFT_417403 [Astrocystis sublimbata]